MDDDYQAEQTTACGKQKTDEGAFFVKIFTNE